MKITREFLWRNPRDLDRLLNEPFRANKNPDDPERWKAIAEQTEARIEALFAKYHIPAEWPELIQWEQLARALAGELYPGCRTIERGRGGTRKVLRLKNRQQKRILFEKFSKYLIQQPSLSERRAADLFIKKHEPECEAIKLRTPRSFLKARRTLSKDS